MVVLFLSSFRRQACQSVRVCHGYGDPFSGISWLNFELHFWRDAWPLFDGRELYLELATSQTRIFSNSSQPPSLSTLQISKNLPTLARTITPLA